MKKVSSPYLSLSGETTRWTFGDNRIQASFVFLKKNYTFAHIDRISWIIDPEIGKVWSWSAYFENTHGW